MNQILMTGEEKVKKDKKVLGINSIVIFYAISIIILGICTICGTVYAMGKINETVEANTRPSLEVLRNDEASTVDIKVTHIRGIQKIEYAWNDGEVQEVNTNNQKEYTETIELLGGTNQLSVAITEENGQRVAYNNITLIGKKPDIKLEAVSNGIKLTSKSEDGINYITYSWDDEEAQRINVGKKEYEGIINAPKGQHTLKINIVDINGNTTTKEQVVVGDTAPTVNVSASIKDEKLIFVIQAEDDENITDVKILLNDVEVESTTVNEKTYYKEIEMIDGVENRIAITIYNQNGLSTTIRRKFDNSRR